jgi:hypothetical protein
MSRRELTGKDGTSCGDAGRASGVRPRKQGALPGDIIQVWSQNSRVSCRSQAIASVLVTYDEEDIGF